MKNNLLKSLLLFVFTILGTTSSWALTANLSMDYELAGWKAKTFYDFTANADGVLPTEGDLRYRADYGLYNFGSGGRSGDVAIAVAEGELLICQFADTQNRGATINSISCCTKNTELSDKAGHIFFDVDTEANTITFNVGRAGCVVSVLVMEKDENATTADYTLNYLLDETTVKSVTGTMAVGGVLLTDASFFADDVKYFRADGEAESFTIAASGNTFIVKVRLASTYNYTLQSNLGATLATGADFEGEAPRVGYPRYQFVDGKLYEAPVDNKEFRKTVNLTEDNVSVIVNYTEKEGANAVFYVEGENVEGMTVSETGNIPVRASYALAGAATEDVTITSLPAGKYKLHVGIFASKSSYQEKVVNFGIGNEKFAAAFTGVNLNEVASEEYTLTTSTDIKYIAEGSWADAQFDYIWIEKTGVVLTDGEAITALSEYVGKEVNVTYTRQFTQGKISTVCLPFAYEKKEGDGSFYGFTNIEKEGSEYVATMTETSSTTLEASTPYLYLPNATGDVNFSGTYTIPAELTAGETTSNGWTFKGTFETIEWAAAPEGVYGFAAQDEDGIYQGQFVKVGKYVRIKPMRCYLENKDFAGARGTKRASENLPDTIKVRLVGADGEVTAIGTISTKTGEVTLDKDAWYTLDGRRVMNPTNGLYIKNGKKVVIK